MTQPHYPSDLTDEEWAIVEPLIPPAKPGGRPRRADMRQILNALFYQQRTGCQWRALPRDYPPWPMVWTYFWQWRTTGAWETLHTQVREALRQYAGREAPPSAAIMGSQSVKTHAGGTRGFDGAKKVAGRKRHILVDTQGFLLTVVANTCREA